MRRGEIWWAGLSAPAGRHPVLLMTRDDVLQVRAMVTVIPITSTMRGLAAEVKLGPADGLPKRCVANTDNIITISKQLLTDRITSLSDGKMIEVFLALKYALGFAAL